MAELGGLFGGDILPPVARVLHPHLPLIHLNHHCRLFLHHKYFHYQATESYFADPRLHAKSIYILILATPFPPTL